MTRRQLTFLALALGCLWGEITMGLIKLWTHIQIPDETMATTFFVLSVLFTLFLIIMIDSGKGKIG